jgi:hypothetical protein
MNYLVMNIIVKKFSYIIQIYKVYDVNKKNISINFNIIILKL